MGPDPTGGPPGLGGAGEDLVMDGEFQPTDSGVNPLEGVRTSRARNISATQSGALNASMGDRDG